MAQNRSIFEKRGRRRFLQLIAISAVCAGCQGPKPEPAAPSLPVTWSSALGLAGIEDIDARLQKPFDDAFETQRAGKPIPMKNCADFLAAGKDWRAATEQSTLALKSAGIVCLALEALKGAMPSKSSNLTGFKLDGNALDMLPPALGPVVSLDDEKALQAASGKSWKEFTPAATGSVNAAGTLVVIFPGWRIKLTEYARGDFNGDGIEDLLVRDDVAATEGTYGESRLFLLGRTSPGGILQVEKQF